MDVMSQWLVLSGRVVYPLFLLAGLFFSSFYSQATERQITPAERTLERQQQLDLLQQQADKLKQLQDLPQPVVSEPIVTEDSNAQCFSINHIELDGASLLSTAEQATLLSPWLNTCVGIAQINQLVKTITNHYIEAGYVTSRAYIPQQNLSDGHLFIQVIEGRVESFQPLPGSGLVDSELAMAFPGLKGDYLNLRALEQGIDQMNRLPSNQAQLKLQPGSKPGETVVGIDNQPSKPWRVSLGYHNNGSESTGDRQWQGSVEWDNPLQLNDQLRINLAKDAITDQYRQSRSSSLSYRLPYGYWTFNYDFSYSDYETRNESNGFPFDSDGDTRNHTATVSRLLHRDQAGKTSASLSVRHTRTRNFIEDSRIDVSSYQLSELSLGLNHGRRLWRGLLNLDIAAQRGMPWFDAVDTHNPTAGQPVAQHEKYTATISYLLPFTLWDNSFTFNSLATGQKSADVLYGPMRFTAGGLGSVRGFREQSLSGDSGGYWRNDLSWRTPVTFQGINTLFQQFTATLAYDVGVITRDQFNPERHGRLSSKALAFSLAGEHLSISTTIAESLSRPDSLPDKEYPVWFQVNLSM
ncbi:ShlB/FhaC/HecB family hemolysin secretion/activation protein [Endozoicomonas acroporae]|uniref:ShlB/FhaC/HecB family hemolysin secretion/activation protein n=1 Tax=Endozoicomonas acroporae TaxID=1701104 RepID=UPI003D7ABACB